MKTLLVTLDAEVLDLLKADADAWLTTVTDVCRVALTSYLVQHRRLKRERLTATGRLIPDDRPRPAERKRARKGVGR